jgi:hypothetical protein
MEARVNHGLWQSVLDAPASGPVIVSRVVEVFAVIGIVATFDVLRRWERMRAAWRRQWQLDRPWLDRTGTRSWS